MNARSIPTISERAETASTAIALSSLERRVGRILIRSATPMMPPYPSIPSSEREQIDAGMELFLVRQIFSMPRYLMVPFVIALLAFDMLPLVRSGRTFCSLSEERRAGINNKWTHSRIAQKRDLIKLIRNCALYYYLDHPLVRDRIESAEKETNAG